MHNLDVWITILSRERKLDHDPRPLERSRQMQDALARPARRRGATGGGPRGVWPGAAAVLRLPWAMPKLPRECDARVAAKAAATS